MTSETPSGPPGTIALAEPPRGGPTATRSSGPADIALRIFTARWTGPLLALAGMVSWIYAVRKINPYNLGALGLITHLHAAWWLGLLLVTLSVISELTRPVPRTTAMVWSLLVLAFVLHGTLPAAESTPRFGAAYAVSGFSDYVGRTGQTLPRLDARMSWPALFSAAGMTAQAMRVPTTWFLRWTPLVLNLAYLFPLKALANSALRSPRARWAALAIFLAADWIDQDYFSPQGVGLLLFLAVIVIAVRAFGGRELHPWPVPAVMRWRWVNGLGTRITELLRLPLDAVTGELEPEPTTARSRFGLLALALVFVGAIVVSHQITPVALTLVLFGLTVIGRTRLKSLFLVVAVLVFAWLSWEARAYWQGHLGKIFGSFGNISSTFNASVTKRVHGTSFGRQLVQRSRIAAGGLTWAGALAGFWVLWWRGRTYWTILILGLAPIAVAGAVTYGGEVVLRVLLFSLVPAAILTAGLLDADHLRRLPVIACLVVSLGLLALFPLTRYGNESFEAISPGDLKSAAWIHANVPHRSLIYVANRDEPLNYTHPGLFKLVELGEVVFATGPALARGLPASTQHPTWIYVSHSEYEDGVNFSGYPKGWLQNFIGHALQTGKVQIAYSNEGSYVLRVDRKPASVKARKAPATAAGGSSG